MMLQSDAPQDEESRQPSKPKPVGPKAVLALGNMLYPGLFFQNDRKFQSLQPKPTPYRPFGIFGRGAKGK